MAAITEPLFLHRGAIRTQSGASAARDVQAISAVCTEHLPTKQSMRTVTIRVFALLSATSIPQLLSLFKYFRLDDPQFRAFLFDVAVDEVAQIGFISHHPNQSRGRDVLAVPSHDVVLYKVVADSLYTVAFINVFLEYQTDDLCFFLVDFQLTDFLIFLVHATLFYTLVPESNRSTGIVTFLCKLFYTGASTDRSFDTFAGCLPVADVVHQLIDMGIKTLLTFIYAPDLDPLLREPFHDKGRFVVTPTQTVKHEHQQNIKLSGSSSLLKQLELIAVFCRFLKTGNAFFGKLLDDFPALPFCKFVAGFFLHGYVILFDLSNGRNAV